MNLLRFPGSALGLLGFLAVIAVTSGERVSGPNPGGNYQTYTDGDRYRPYGPSYRNSEYEENYYAPETYSNGYGYRSSSYSPEEYEGYGYDRRDYGDTYRNKYARSGYSQSESCEYSDEYDQGYNYRNGYNKAERKSYRKSYGEKDYADKPYASGYRVIYPGSGYEDKYTKNYGKGKEYNAEKEYKPRKSYRKKVVKKAKYPESYTKTEYRPKKKESTYTTY